MRDFDEASRKVSSGASPEDYGAAADRLREPLLKFVSGYVRDRHAAEDLVQETLLRAFRNLHRYRGGSSLKTWVFSIARNLCLDFLRASARSRLRLLEMPDPTALDQALPQPIGAGPLDPGRRAEQVEGADRIERAVTRLPSETRDLLTLRIHLGCSYREIARRCGISPVSVGRRLARAQRRLSRELA